MLQIRLNSDMYKLSIHIYSQTIYLLIRVKSVMSLKVGSNLGVAQENSKSGFVHDFFIFTYESIDFMWLFGVKI